MNFVRQFETNSDDETRAVGRQLAQILPRSAVVSLIGELGAGKTTLTKGIVEGRGVSRGDEVSSPTFSLIHEYGEPVSVYHIDLYRLNTLQEASRLGLEELYDRPGLVLIEWADRFPPVLPERRHEIRISSLENDKRIIQLYEAG